MNNATATTTRAHHNAAAHAPRLNDKGQPLPDDGTPFAQLLADGLDDNANVGATASATPSDTGLTDATSTPNSGSKPLPGPVSTTPPDSSTDAALAAWIGQALAKHNGTNATDLPQTPASGTDAQAALANPSSRRPVLADAPNGADNAAADDKTSDAAAGHAGNHASRHHAPNLLGAAGASARPKASDSMAAVASSHAQAIQTAKAALNDAAAARSTPNTAIPTVPDQAQPGVNGAVTTATGGAGTASTTTGGDTPAPLTLVAAASERGGAQSQAHTGSDGGNAQPSFQGAANTASSAAAGGSEGASGSNAAPSFSQALNQAFDALGAQVSFWSNNQVQRASMDLDTGSGEPLKVDVTLHEGKVHLDFKTDDANTRDALHQNATGVLSDLLSRNGIDLGGVSVGAQNSGRDNRSADQGATPGSWGGLTRALGAAGAADTTAGTPQRLVRSDRALDLYA